MPRLQSKDHERNWVASSPHNQAISARFGQADESGSATSELSYATPRLGENRSCRYLDVQIGVLMGCLSRMQGNLHVRFLGEGVAARSPPYPPHEEGSIPFARSTELPEISTISRHSGQPIRLAFLLSGGRRGACRCCGRLAACGFCQKSRAGFPHMF